jgi:hypothetical protein
MHFAISKKEIFTILWAKFIIPYLTFKHNKKYQSFVDSQLWDFDVRKKLRAFLYLCVNSVLSSYFHIGSAGFKFNIYFINTIKYLIWVRKFDMKIR